MVTIRKLLKCLMWTTSLVVFGLHSLLVVNSTQGDHGTNSSYVSIGSDFFESIASRNLDEGTNVELQLRSSMSQRHAEAVKSETAVEDGEHSKRLENDGNQGGDDNGGAESKENQKKLRNKSDLLPQEEIKRLRGLPVYSQHSQERMLSYVVNQAATQKANPPPMRRSRTLIGIITSASSGNDRSYRKRHRQLHQLWNDTRYCPLHEFESRADAKQLGLDDCQVLFTFIVGGAPEDDHTAPTLLVDDSRPLIAPKLKNVQWKDVNGPDTTLLNIRENMNEGKSPTFLYFASQIMDRFKESPTPIDYAMKLDADSILHLHDFLLFAHGHLPPAPYNRNTFVGALRDKAYWPKHPQNDMPRFESFFGNEFDGVHLYIAGQCYIVSHDLAKFIAMEAKHADGYLEGHEDHDVTTMAFHSPDPVHLITISRSQRFWEHPVKGQPRWLRIWERESARMSGTPFRGKHMHTYGRDDIVSKEAANS